MTAERGPEGNPAPVAPGLLADLNFRRLWIGSVTASLGTAVGSIIVVWLVYSETGSPLAVSLLGILQFLPTLAFGLLAGALIDRLDRRRLMVACDAARAISFGALAIFVLVYGADTFALLLVVSVVATFSTIFRPATNATIPRILAPDQVTNANGLLQGAGTVASFVGSPLGGLLLVAAGAVVGLALNALTFAISGTLIFLMAIPSGNTGTARAARSLLREVREGLRFLASQRALLTITLTAMAANFFLSIWGGFTVIYVVSRLGQGATAFGLVTAATTAGFALGAVLPGRLRTDRSPGLLLTISWGVTGFFIVGLALTRSLAVASVLEFATGAALSFGNTTWLAAVQRSVPDEYLGRFFATDEAGSYAMIPAGVAVGGVLVLYIGISGAFLVAGVGTLLTNVPLVLSAPVRRWGKPPVSEPPSSHRSPS